MASSVEKDTAWQEVVATRCDLCAKEDDVDDFCRECHQYLCATCKEQHLRTTYCMNHRIVSKSEGYKLDHVQKAACLCNDHNEPFIVFCRTCGHHICTRCLTDKHNGHHYEDIDTFADELHNKVKKQIQQKTDEANYTIQTLTEYSKSCNCAISKCDESIASLEHVAADLINDVKLIENAMKKRISKRKSELLANENLCQERLSAVTAIGRRTADLERERQNQSDISIAGFFKPAQEELKTFTIPKLPLSLLISPIEFVPGNATVEKLQQVMGDISNVEGFQEYPLKGFATYEICPGMKGIADLWSLCYTDDACLCISVTNYSKNKLVKIQQDMSIICEMQLPLYPYSLQQADGDNILASFNNETIKLLNLTDKTETTLYSITDTIFGDAVVTKDKEFLVVVLDERHRPIVHHLDRQGTLIREIDVGEGLSDEDVSRIQSLVPYKEGEYLIVMEDDNCVYKMDSTFRISKPLIIVHEEAMHIARITSDNSGFIICCDENGSLNAYNEDGEMLYAYEMTQILDGDKVNCVTVDKDNNLIVGTRQGDVFAYVTSNGIIRENEHQLCTEEI